MPYGDNPAHDEGPGYGYPRRSIRRPDEARPGVRGIPRDDHQHERVPADDVTGDPEDWNRLERLSVVWPEVDAEFRFLYPEVALWVDKLKAYVHPDDEAEARRRQQIVIGAGVDAFHFIQTRLRELGEVDGAPKGAISAWGVFGAIALLEGLVIANTWATLGYDPQMPTKIGSAATLMAFPIAEQLKAALPPRHVPPTGPFRPSPEAGGPQDRH